MSTKATKESRIVTKALARSNKVAEEARQATKAAKLAEDAVKAAIAAACAAERAELAENSKANSATGMRNVMKSVRSAAEEAVERAKDAMKAESEGDVVSAVCSANLSVRAAQRTSALAATASVIIGKARELASEQAPEEPKITVSEERPESSRNRPGDVLSPAINHAARYLVTYDDAIIATFAREEDAILLESELADLDRLHGATSGKCEVLERKTGHHLGGYLIAGGKMFTFLCNEKRSGKK